MESAVLEDKGEMDRGPCGVCVRDSTGELKDETEGADGISVDAGTDARYSAPPWYAGDDVGDCTLPTRFLLLDMIEGSEPSRLCCSSVRVRGRYAFPLSSMTPCVRCPLLLLSLRARKDEVEDRLTLPFLLCGGLIVEPRVEGLSWSPRRRLLLVELLGLSRAAAAPPTMVVVVCGTKTRS